MSKQELARKIIAHGDKRAFNTLRKYSVEALETILASYMPTTVSDISHPVDSPEQAPYIPTDAEQMQAARADLAQPSVPVASNRWLALALSPFLMLRAICGI